MRIDNIMPYHKNNYGQSNGVKKVAAPHAVTAHSKSNHDIVTISQKTPQISTPELNFEQQIASLSGGIYRQPVSQERIEEIKTQVQNGTYHVADSDVAEAIISRIKMEKVW